MFFLSHSPGRQKTQLCIDSSLKTNESSFGKRTSYILAALLVSVRVVLGASEAAAEDAADDRGGGRRPGARVAVDLVVPPRAAAVATSLSCALRDAAAGAAGAVGAATGAARVQITPVAPAHEQIFVGLPVLGAHHHVNDRIGARGEVDENVAEDVQVAQLDLLERFGDGDGQVAHEEAHEDHQDHFQQLLVFGRHLAGLRRRRRARPPVPGAFSEHRRDVRQRRVDRHVRGHAVAALHGRRAGRRHGGRGAALGRDAAALVVGHRARVHAGRRLVVHPEHFSRQLQPHGGGREERALAALGLADFDFDVRVAILGDAAEADGRVLRGHAVAAHARGDARDLRGGRRHAARALHAQQAVVVAAARRCRRVVGALEVARARLKRRFAHDVEDARVAHHDRQAGDQKADDEEELFGRVVLLVRQNGAAADVRVQPELAPLAQQGGNQRTESRQPRARHHQRQVLLLV